MGAFEYFQLAEALGAEPLWVINNGISHTYSVPAENIWPLVQVPPPPFPPRPHTATCALESAVLTRVTMAMPCGLQYMSQLWGAWGLSAPCFVSCSKLHKPFESTWLHGRWSLSR